MSPDPTLLLRLREPKSALDYDLNLLAVTLQGLANREGPRVLVEHHLGKMEVLGTDLWLERLRQPGQWLADRELVALSDVAELLRHVKPEALAIFDPEVPASSHAALNLAAAKGWAVTGPEGLAWLGENGIDLPIGHDFRGQFSGKGDVALFAIEQAKARENLNLLSYVLDAHRRAQGGDANCMDVEGLDRVIAEQGVAFDLSPFADELPVDDPTQPMGQDREHWDALFNIATANRGADVPLEVMGFPHWPSKYSNFGEAGGQRRPVEAEWEAVWQISRHGAYLNPLIGPNMTFHRWASLPALKQPDPGPLPPLENKTYVCLHLGDFDGGFGLYRKFPHLWSDPRRGELPMGWGINPNLAANYPDLIADAYATRTPNDHFWADAGAAGYVNPNRMSPEDLERWRRFCVKCFERLDYSIAPMVLDQNPPTPAVLDAFASFARDGAAWLLENRQGETVGPLQRQVWKGMPIAPLHDMSYAKSDDAYAPLMRKYAEGDDLSRPSFHLYRFEWRMPGFVYDAFHAASENAEREWVVLHPKHWFGLLKQSLA